MRSRRGLRAPRSVGAGRGVFFGPPDGPRPFSEMIRVSRRPGDSPESHRASHVAVEVFMDPHRGRRTVYVRTVLIPSRGGVFALEHEWPEGASPSRAVFDGVLSSFRAP